MLCPLAGDRTSGGRRPAYDAAGAYGQGGPRLRRGGRQASVDVPRHWQGSRERRCREVL